MKISIKKIKPDPDQPRRTFNQEKMQALEASMKDHGFRKQYPIIINGGNIIVDGERRWRAARAVGIKEVPVEIIENISRYDRRKYQLQSEGAELEYPDRCKAWYDQYLDGKKIGKSIREIAKEHSIRYRDFYETVTVYGRYEKTRKESGITVTGVKNVLAINTLGEIGIEKDSKLRKCLAIKATKENWTQKKAREIRRAIKERPLCTKQILAQDYSDPYEGSSQWETRLEVAKSDIDIQALEDMRVNRDKMFKQVDKWDQLTKSIITMRVAWDEFDFKLAPPEIRVKLHKTLTSVLPSLKEYIQELEAYMIENGELTGSIKKLKE